jgi:hypothetical protein
MSAKITYAKMLQVRNTAGWFSASNPKLADGQIGVINAGLGMGRFKFGDGMTSWNSLPWARDGQAADDLAAEAQARINGDNAEAQARNNADNAHAQLFTAHGSTATPAAGRIAMYGAETGLKSGKAPVQGNDVVRKLELDAEAQARANGDAALQQALNAEAAARAAADALLAPLHSPHFTGIPTTPDPDFTVPDQAANVNAIIQLRDLFAATVLSGARAIRETQGGALFPTLRITRDGALRGRRPE